eukprot:GHVU01069790.1.p1 GENE.GHVU01069790.1~~GHVU01069790.1.p1  ORF type:complete len:244 (-),score=25.51 GHVU01069790.1:873-1604(-)
MQVWAENAVKRRKLREVDDTLGDGSGARGTPAAQRGARGHHRESDSDDHEDVLSDTNDDAADGGHDSSSYRGGAYIPMVHSEYAFESNYGCPHDAHGSPASETSALNLSSSSSSTRTASAWPNSNNSAFGFPATTGDTSPTAAVSSVGTPLVSVSGYEGPLYAHGSSSSETSALGLRSSSSSTRLVSGRPHSNHSALDFQATRGHTSSTGAVNSVGTPAVSLSAGSRTAAGVGDDGVLNSRNE